LLKNNGFGEGLFAMSSWLMRTLLPLAPATASTRSTGLPLLSLLPFSFTFTFPLLLPILFSFPFSFFIFRFFSFLFLFSFYFLFFYLFSFLPSFNILVALLEGGRKGIINSYQHFY
jgi:hypothetical protein